MVLQSAKNNEYLRIEETKIAEFVLGGL